MIMQDVVFITPNMGGELAEEAIGTLQLATILSNHGINCEVLPFFLIGSVSDFEGFLSNAMSILADRQPKIVSFYTRCDTYHIDLALARKIKELCKNTYVVFGGPQSDITAEETIRQIPYVDYVCCGEGEHTIYPFFSSLMADKPDVSVPGLVYRCDGKVIKNPRPVLMQDLDHLPLIDYSFFRHSQKKLSTDRYYFPIDVGRGCPFGCTYCSTKTFWGRKYRVKSPERIYQEIKAVRERFGVTHFAFAHDMFTLNRNTVIRTCELLRTLDFPIQWKCSARLDCIDPELIDIMAEAGMERIFIGIETGSPRMQKLINKNLKLDRAVQILSYLKEKGVNTTASFIYGFPEETEEDLSQTLGLIRDLLALKTVAVQAHLCTFLSGTELSDRYISQMTRTEQYSDVTGNFAIEQCRDLIDGHPELFLHMLEYKTDLRTRLQYFKIFLYMWQITQPVYQYLAEQYPQERLIDMYFDFCDANMAVLEEIVDLPSSEWFSRLIAEDAFPKRFTEDKNYDIIQDYYRMRVTETSEAVKKGEPVSGIFCFPPKEREKDKKLQEYKRCIAVVSWADGKRTTSVYPLPPKS